MLIQTIRNSLNELTVLLLQLSDKQYCMPCSELSNATIGEHTRHIIEMFQCLHRHYEFGVVDYDKRERNLKMQTNTQFAIDVLEHIKFNIDKPNKDIQLMQIVCGETITFNSNYFRELLYNLEHCVHHQALIKVALFRYDYISVDQNFGVAQATIEHRK